MSQQNMRNPSSTWCVLFNSCILMLVFLVLSNDQHDVKAEIAQFKNPSQLLYSPMSQQAELESGELVKTRRRLSGFMPMRGKKNSQLPEILGSSNQQLSLSDQEAAGQVSGWSPMATAIEPAPRELESAESGISRLALMGNPLTSAENWSPMGAGPRRFLYQVVASQQQRQNDKGQVEGNQLSSQDDSWLTRQGAPSGGNLGNNFAAWTQHQPASMLMEAKLRRAFHPMRGKRGELLVNGGFED